MGLVKFGNGVAGISGKVSGSIFARNAAGAYVRNWAKPINPGTPRQTDVRSFFAAASAAFSILVLAEVAAWDAYAAALTRVNRQGDSYTPTGRQTYIECYSNMTAIGETPLDVPSAFSNVPGIISLGVVTAEEDSGEIGTLTMAPGVFVIPSAADPPIVIVEAAPAHKASVTNVNTQFRQIFTGDGSTTMNLAAGYIAVFGNSVVAGQTISLRVRVIDTTSGLGSTRMLINSTLVPA